MMTMILMKLLKILLAVALTLAVTLCACLRCPDASTASAGADIKGKTVSQALEMDGAAYMNWLQSHEHDDYYLGTPYAPWDHRNPNGDAKVTILDATAIQRYLAALPTNDRIGTLL